MARKAWKCPECGVILAPHVNEHRCDGEGGAMVKVGSEPPPWTPSTSVSTATFSAGTIVTYTNAMPGNVVSIQPRSTATFTRDIA